MNDPIENNVKNYPNSLETRVALVEMAILNINQTLIRLENKIDSGFSEIKREMRNDFRLLLTVIGGLGAIMAHGFKWF